MEIALKNVTGFQLDHIERNGRVLRIVDPPDDSLLGTARAANTEEQKSRAKLEAGEASHRRGIVTNSEPGTKRICLEARNIVQRPDEESDRPRCQIRSPLRGVDRAVPPVRRRRERTRPAIRCAGGIDRLSAIEREGRGHDLGTGARPFRETQMAGPRSSLEDTR